MLWWKGFRKNLGYFRTREPRRQFLSAIKIFTNLGSGNRFAVCPRVFLVTIAFRVVDQFLKRNDANAYFLAVLLNQFLRIVRPIKRTIPRVGAWAGGVPT